MSSPENTYQWSIATLAVPNLTVNGVSLQGVVSEITQVRCVASDGVMSGDDNIYSPDCPVAISAPDPTAFVPLDKLTSDNLQAMAQAALGPVEWASLQSRADIALANAITQAAVAQAAAIARADAPIPGPTVYAGGDVVIPAALTTTIAALTAQAANPAQPTQTS